MKRTILIWVLLAGLISCRKETIKTENVPSYVVAVVPYRADQIVKFISSSGDTIKTKVDFLSTVSTRSGSDPDEKIYTETQYIKLRTSGIISTVYADFQLTGLQQNKNYIFRSVRNAGCDFMVIDGQPKFNCGYQNCMCLDTFTVRSKKYSYVLKYTVVRDPNLTYRTTARVYYTREDGIIQVDYSDSTSDYLLK